MSKTSAFLKSYNKSDEQLDFRSAVDMVDVPVDVISTGSISLDDALSCGGLPKGRIIQYYGPSGSGKTLLTMIAIVEAQKQDPDAEQVFIDAEQTFSPTWAESLGADLSKVIVIDGDMATNGRKCFEMLLGIPKEDAKHILVGKSKDGLLDKIINKEININLIILDSIGAIIPPGEDVSAVGKKNISLMASFLTTTFKKLSLDVSKANVPFIVINHKRDSMDPYKDHTSSGGNTYFHMLSANVYFESIMRKDAMIMDEKENKVGHAMRATVEKSKFGPWPRKCEFKVNFSTGIIDRHEEIVNLALSMDVFERLSAVSLAYKDQKWVGMPKLLASVAESPELQEQLLADIANKRKEQADKRRVEREAKKKLSDVAAKERNKKSKKDKEKVSDQSDDLDDSVE